MFAFPVHLVIEPLTIVLPAIWPFVLTFSLDSVLEELPDVFRAIGCGPVALTVLLTSFELAFIAAFVRPSHLALAVLQVVLPLPFIVRVSVIVAPSFAVGLVISPFALVDIAVSINHAALTFHLILDPAAFVN